MKKRLVVWFRDTRMKDVGLVGGKIASLGEMIRRVKVPIPRGFATTSLAYRDFIRQNKLEPEIRHILSGLDAQSVADLKKRGKAIRKLILNAPFPPKLEQEILSRYRRMGQPFVAVRSSATAEDLPGASFAGQQETFLNVRGNRDLLRAVKKCMASLFTDRAIHYRVDKGFDHRKVYLAVGVQEMVNARASGVMFTLDPDSGFRNVVFINGTWGLGELLVGGRVNPDEFMYFKPTKAIINKELGAKKIKLVRGKHQSRLMHTTSSEQNRYVLSDKNVTQLAKFGLAIEKHYRHPMDIEWAKDMQGQLYILQARPETVYSAAQPLQEDYTLLQKSTVRIAGRSVGKKIGAGVVNKIMSARDLGKFRKGDVLVTKMTNPDWEPIMKIASAIVTDKGGTTSHAAIVSRELGIPAVIGTEKASRVLKNREPVTVDCTSAEGKVWKGKLKYRVKKTDIRKIPKTRTQVMVNISVPDTAFNYASLPVDGVGLARQEFIVSSSIGKHPLWMIRNGRGGEYCEKLSYGIAKIAAAFYPKPVVLRLSDFKTNEYAQLYGGREFEPKEENPMLGFRGAVRYSNKTFEPAFALECKAIRKVREDMGLTNIKVMVPFCRTVEQGREVIRLMKKFGLKRSRNFEFYVMAEIPSNIILAEKFAKYFDGFSIGSNDLTQLTLGVGRDNELLAREFDERDEAVKISIERLIRAAHKHRRKVGFCGDAPSKFTEYSAFLAKNHIDSISVTPDFAVKTRLSIRKAEKRMRR